MKNVKKVLILDDGIHESGNAIFENNVVVIHADLERSRFERESEDLLVLDELGNTVHVRNFFAAGPDGLSPTIALPDGRELAAEEFLSTYGSGADEEMEEPLWGSGSGEYVDESGDLVAGIDRLGSLGTDWWADGYQYTVERLAALEQESEESPAPAVWPGISSDPIDPMQPPVVAPADPTPPPRPTDPVRPGPTDPPIDPPTDPDPDPDPDPTDPPDDPDPSSFTYSARAVLHAQDVDLDQIATYSVDAYAIFDSLARMRAGTQAPEVTYLGGDGSKYLTVTVKADGTITFTLKPEALEYFQTNTDEKYIENYYKVALNGKEYTMQVIVPVHGEFESERYPELCKHGEGVLVHGEWHAGQCIEDNGKVYKVTSTNMADIMTYDGVVHNAAIYTGHGAGDWGADIVNVNCHVQADGLASKIIAKGADSAVYVHGDRADGGVVLALAGGANTIEVSGKNGLIDVTNAPGHGAIAESGSVALKANGENGQVRIADTGTALHAKGGTVNVEASGKNGLVNVDTVTQGALAESGSIGLKANGEGGQVRITDTVTALHAKGGTVAVEAAGTNGLIHIAEASDHGALAESGPVTLKANGENGRVHIDGGGTGLYANGGTVSAQATGTNGSVVIENVENGLLSGNGGTGSLTSGIVRVSASGTGTVQAIAAEAGGTNTVSAGTGKVTINAAASVAGTDGAAYGLRATGDGASNTVTAASLDITVGSTVTGMTSNLIAAGVHADGFGAANTVTVAGDATFDMSGDGGYIAAINAANGATNTITAKDILITGNSSNSQLHGIKAGNDGWNFRDDGSENIITANSLTIKNDSNNYPGKGLNAYNGSNTVTLKGANADGNALDIDLKGSALEGINNNFGDTLITNEGSGDIRITLGFRPDEDGVEQPWSLGKVRGFNTGAGTTTIHNNGNDMHVAVAGKGDAAGLYSGSGGTLSVNNVGTLSIESYGQRGSKTSLDEPDYDSGRWPMGSVGLKVLQGGVVSIEDTGTVTMDIHGTGGQYFCTGILSGEGGTVSVNRNTETANAISMTVEGDFNASGMQNLGQSPVERGSFFYVGGKATTEVSITAKSTSDDAEAVAAGVYAYAASQSMCLAHTEITGQTVRFDIDATDRALAVGLYGTQSVVTSVKADRILMEVDAVNNDAYGMYGVLQQQGAGAGCEQTLEARNVTMDIGSEHGNAYGMYNHSATDFNKIRSDGALDLSITCEAGGRAYAMYAAGGNNIIEGNSAAGEYDLITLTGDLVANSSRTNSITTGKGDDIVTVNGNLSGNNAISLGDGDDMLILNGSFSGCTFSGGKGFDTLRLDGAGDDFSLSGLKLSGKLTGFECLDLTGGNDNTLTVDTLLANLGLDAGLEESRLGGALKDDLIGQQAMVVKLDDGDSVLLAGDWSGKTSSGQVSYDGTFYDVYKYESGLQEEYLLLQSLA